MYKIFTDKGKLFKCNIDISGASLDECYARILLETEEKTFLYKGKVKSNGLCEVEIPKLKNMFNEGVEGKIKLEVIVENTLFNPWESDFVVEASKKVNVQVEEEEETPIKESKIDDKLKVSIIMEDEDEEETKTKVISEKKEEVKETKKEEIKEEKVVENTKTENRKIINSKDDSVESEIFDFESFFKKK